MEGHIKYLLEKHSCHIDKYFSCFIGNEIDGYTLSKVIPEPDKTNIERCYNHYVKTRHKIFHFGDIMGCTDNTFLISTKQAADDIIRETLRLINNSAYKLIFIEFSNIDERSKSMNDNFKLFFHSHGQFSCQVLCLSYASIYSYIELIQAELRKNKILNANILIDQLLITGNSKNRFLAIKLINGEFSFSDAINVSPEAIHRQFTSTFLRKQQKILKSSILTQREIAMLNKGSVL